MLDPGRKPGRAARPHGADRAEGQGRSPLLGGPPPALPAALPAGDPAPSTSRPATGACPRVCLCCDSSSGRHVLGSPGSHPPWMTASVPTAGFASCVLICHLLVSTRGGSSSIGGGLGQRSWSGWPGGRVTARTVRSNGRNGVLLTEIGPGWSRVLEPSRPAEP